eukprot:2414179-Amphidinium_carterae.2
MEHDLPPTEACSHLSSLGISPGAHPAASGSPVQSCSRDLDCGSMWCAFASANCQAQWWHPVPCQRMLMDPGWRMQ